MGASLTVHHTLRNLLKRLSDDTRQHSHQPVALDLAVINTLGPRNWGASCRNPAAAAAA